MKISSETSLESDLPSASASFCFEAPRGNSLKISHLAVASILVGSIACAASLPSSPSAEAMETENSSVFGALARRI